MKRILFIIMGAMLLMACNNNSYSSQLKEEKKQIDNYIKMNNIHLIDTMPPRGTVWPEKDYYKVPGYDYCYFHLVSDGQMDKDSVIAGETVVMRYRQYTLTANPEVDSYWTTMDGAFPVEFKYRSDYTTACVGWHIAVSLMAFPEAECKLICPSKLGSSADQSAVIAYGYDLKMKIRR